MNLSLSMLAIILLAVVASATAIIIWQRRNAHNEYDFDGSDGEDDVIMRGSKSETKVAAKNKEQRTEPRVSAPVTSSTEPEKTELVVINLLAKDEQVFAGFELLQAILSSGLRYGDMNIFHRYPDGQTGRPWFSLASAQEPGTFDIQRMAEFSCVGLTLFMQAAPSSQAQQQLDLMIDTAEQLARQLNAHLCDAKRQPFTTATKMLLRERLAAKSAWSAETASAEVV